MQDPTPSRTRTPFPLRQAARDGDVALVLGWAQAVGTKWGTCPPIPEEYLLELWRRLIRAVIAVLDESVPMMFSAQPPKDEPDFNQKVGAVLRTHIPQLQSEHPLASFACAGYTPDHVIQGNHLEIESKYIRTNTSPAKARDGISADLTNKPEGSAILFVVYDPDRRITDDRTFREHFESKGSCVVRILR